MMQDLDAYSRALMARAAVLREITSEVTGEEHGVGCQCRICEFSVRALITVGAEFAPIGILAETHRAAVKILMELDESFPDGGPELEGKKVSGQCLHCERPRQPGRLACEVHWPEYVEYVENLKTDHLLEREGVPHEATPKPDILRRPN